MSNPDPVDGVARRFRPRAELRDRANRWYFAAAAFAAFATLAGAMVLIPPCCSISAARRSQCKNNLKQIGLALHNYHDQYGCFPPAYLADENGRPMHSWRVLLLPFLDQVVLYKKYRFEEPWDGPNNCKLADQIVAVYNCPSDAPDQKHNASSMTSYLAVVGPETAWPGSSSTSFEKFKDGTSNTLLVVEVANSGIHWMEPRDLHVLQMSPTVNAKSGQGISSRHTGGAHLLRADGSVWYVSEQITPEQVRALLTPAGDDESPSW